MSTVTVLPEAPAGATGWTHGSDWAVLSDDKTYRYMLGREIHKLHPLKTARVTTFILLNPSTADHRDDDPTVRRCTDFADRLGASLMIIVNLFAHRATDMKALERVRDPVGPLNPWALDWWRRSALQHPTLKWDFIDAWGNASKCSTPFREGAFRAQERRVCALLRPMGLMHMGLTSDQRPRHPLYLTSSTKPQVWM
jgi:hypothetical protein